MPKEVLIPMGRRGWIIRWLEITQEEADAAPKCENCGKKPNIQHELLIKEEKDWCIDCNDEHFRPNATPMEDAQHCIDLTVKGYCAGVLMRAQDGVYHG